MCGEGVHHGHSWCGFDALPSGHGGWVRRSVDALRATSGLTMRPREASSTVVTSIRTSMHMVRYSLNNMVMPAKPLVSTRARPRGSFIGGASPSRRAWRLDELNRSSLLATKRAGPPSRPSGAYLPPFQPAQGRSVSAHTWTGSDVLWSPPGEVRHAFHLLDIDLTGHRILCLNGVREQLPNARVSLMSGADACGMRRLTISGEARLVIMAERLIEAIGIRLNRCLH